MYETLEVATEHHEQSFYETKCARHVLVHVVVQDLEAQCAQSVVPRACAEMAYPTEHLDHRYVTRNIAMMELQRVHEEEQSFRSSRAFAAPTFF